jgi:ribosomal protein L32
MKLINCSECGRVCIENPARICPECIREEELAEEKVAEFLREAKSASLDEIHEATGVKHKIILRMLRSGRIFSDAIISYPCETCGAPITEGRVCDDCSKNIIGQVKTEEWQPQKQVESRKRDERMYITEMIKKNK